MYNQGNFTVICYIVFSELKIMFLLFFKMTKLVFAYLSLLEKETQTYLYYKYVKLKSIVLSSCPDPPRSHHWDKCDALLCKVFYSK